MAESSWPAIFASMLNVLFESWFGGNLSFVLEMMMVIPLLIGCLVSLWLIQMTQDNRRRLKAMRRPGLKPCFQTSHDVLPTLR